jgi:GPH family glycoside/pentoside/hexuronide:cation symporter
MPVPTSRRLAYAAPAFAMAVVGIPVYVFLPKFYSDVVGVDVAFLGLVLLSVRIFDAVTDPLIGLLSDRSRTRFGRRRPWVLLGSLPLAASLAFLFGPPVGLSQPGLWFAVWIYALFLFWTLVTVPYESLGAEITFDYDERTQVLGLRDGMLLAGTVVAAATPSALAALVGLPAGPEGERAKFAWVAALYAPLIVAACTWCALAVRESGAAARANAGLWRGLALVRRNRPFAILLASYGVAAIGSNLPATLLPYYVEYVLHSDRLDLFLVLYLVTGVVFLPAWIRLSERFGKKQAWLGAMALNTGAFAGVFFLGPGDVALYGVLVVLSGVGLGATLAIPSSMQADVIDYDEILSGERREGQYVGLWSLARKLAAAAGVGAALVLFGTSGYQPNAEQSADVQLTLRALYCLVPCLCNAVAFAIALAYPIDRESHRAIREAVLARRRGLPVPDPLRP